MGERLLIVSPSAHSLGELANAMVMAAQLPDRPITVMTSAAYADYARGACLSVRELPRGRRAAEVVGRAVAEPDLAAVILADHHLTALERVHFTVADLIGPAPLICVDSLCLGPEGRRLELAISQHSISPQMRHWFPLEVHTETLPGEATLLRPVPVAGGARGGLAFDLYGTTLRPRHGREQTRESLGIAADRTVIVTAMSNWAVRAMTKPHEASPTRDRDEYLRLRTRWLVELAVRLDRRITLVSLGAIGDPGTIRPAEGAGRVELVNLPGLAMDEFTDLVAAADLYLCDNLTSGAMARAALLGTPVVALTNEAGVWDGSDFVQGWRAEMERVFPHFDFRYLVNPFGWVRELDPLRTDNPYLDAVVRAPAYSLEQQVRICTEALDSAERPARDALVERVCTLPKVPEALERALDPRGPSTADPHHCGQQGRQHVEHR